MSLPPLRAETRFESPYVTMWIDRGIMFCRYADDLRLTLEVARTIVEQRVAFSRGRHYLLLIDMRGISATTGAARKYLASTGATLVLAGALITGSTVNK